MHQQCSLSGSAEPVHRSRSTRPSEQAADDENPERRMRQLKINWMLVAMLCYYLYSGYSVTFPTLHQFVTKSRNATCGLPGLGESEAIYSLSVGLFSAGEILSSLIVVAFTDTVGYMALFFFGLTCQTMGFLIYGLSSAGWMVIVSRILLGMNSAIIISVPFSYIGTSADEYNNLLETTRKRRNNKLNNQLIFATSIVTNCSFVVTLGIVLVVAQFESVNQFRWVAWFEVALGTTMIVLTMLFFRHPLPRVQCKSKIKWKPSQLCKDGKEKGDHQHISLGVVIALVYLLATTYIMNHGYTVLDTLANPILSDYFGFTSMMQSYFFLGVTSVVPITCLIFVIVDRLSIDTRVILVVMLLLSTAGQALLADWQTISSADQCNNFSITKTDSSVGLDLSCHIEEVCSPFEVAYDDVCTGLNQSNSVDNVLSSLSHIVVFPTATSNLINNSQCPTCADTPTVNCQSFSVSQGLICLSDSALSTPGLSVVMDIPNSEMSLCLTLNTSVFLEELGSSSSCQESLSVTLLEEITSFPSIAAQQAQQQCKDHSEAPYYCYWNQDSLITGEHCNDCPSFCRSTRKIPHFAQVFLSVSLLSITAGAGLWVVRAIIVQISPTNIVAVATGLYALTSALSRLITPIWSNLVYVAVGRHTIVPLAILLICQMPIYIGLCFLWKKLKRKPTIKKSSSNEESTVECSTSKEDSDSKSDLKETGV